MIGDGVLSESKVMPKFMVKDSKLFIMCDEGLQYVNLGHSYNFQFLGPIENRIKYLRNNMCDISSLIQILASFQKLYNWIIEIIN